MNEQTSISSVFMIENLFLHNDCTMWFTGEMHAKKEWKFAMIQFRILEFAIYYEIELNETIITNYSSTHHSFSLFTLHLVKYTSIYKIVPNSIIFFHSRFFDRIVTPAAIALIRQ